MDKKSVYLDLNRKISIEVNKKINIKDIGDVYCEDVKLKRMIEYLTIYKSKNEEDWDYITTTDITKKILEFNANLDIIFLGSSETMLEIKSKNPERRFLQFVKVMIVSIILFFGAGIAVINFHEDVNMTKSLEKIYYTLTGIKKSKPLIMTIPYTIGIGIGVLTFFNRVISTSRRRRKEPGPLEVETFLFDKDLEEYILNSLKNKAAENKKVQQ